MNINLFPISRLNIKTIAGVALLAAIVSSLVLHSGQGNLRGAEARAPEKLLRHIVLYKFKETTTPTQVQEVIDTFSALPKQIPQIADFECGSNVSQEGKSEGMTQAFVVSFRSDADLQTYLTHPAHLAYVNVVKDKREKVLVFDYWK